MDRGFARCGAAGTDVALPLEGHTKVSLVYVRCNDGTSFYLRPEADR